MIDAEPQAALQATVQARVAQPPVQLEFTGRAGEYFRIWIVNLFLSILTLGIYSAWAKVRRRRYFYGHAWLAGSNFEYHGDPKAILRGRLIAVALFLAYTLIGRYSPRLAAAAALAALPLAPWLMVRSFRFNAVSTSYRNVRFGFDGSYRAFLVSILPVVVFPLMTVMFGQYDPNGQRAPTAVELATVFLPLVVFALFFPFMSGRLHLMRVNGSRFGASRFTCDATVGQFYGLYVIAWLLSIAFAVAAFLPAGVVAGIALALNKRIGSAGAAISMVAIAAGYVLFISLTLAYTQSRIANLVYNDTSLAGEVRLRSRLKMRRLAWVFLTNFFAIAFSLGLAFPWAAIRLARTRAEALQLEAPDGLEHFVAGAVATVGATGEEVGEIFAFDVSL